MQETLLPHAVLTLDASQKYANLQETSSPIREVACQLITQKKLLILKENLLKF